MGITEFQRIVCTLIASNRIAQGVSYVAGRLEARDWIDVISCHRSIQNAGYLFWAACGKDPGFNPVSLIAEARRSSHYSAEEIDQLEFNGHPPDVSLLGGEWHAILKEAERIVDIIPHENAGRCVIDKKGSLFRGGPRELEIALKNDAVLFHQGTLRGSYPKIVTDEHG